MGDADPGAPFREARKGSLKLAAEEDPNEEE